MKQNWILFSMSLMLSSVSTKTITQNNLVQVAMAEIRKANATKERLNSSAAAGALLQGKIKNFKDSIQVYKDSTQFWKQVANLQTRRKKQWRKVAFISGGIVLAKNSVIGILLKR